MTIWLVWMVLIAVFFALNMGGSGIAPAFAAALGARLISWRWAVIFFIVFVSMGAVLFGHHVVKTLSSGLIPPQTFDIKTVTFILTAASTCIFVAHLFKIPESTSWVTVASISAVGLYHGNLNWETVLYRLLPAWIILPLLAFVLTVGVLRFFYPLGQHNFRLYEYFSKHEEKMRVFVIISSCCVAVAIGSNNVANVVGPLAALGVIDAWWGLWLAAPIFGLGALVFRGAIKTMGKDIVPLGPFSASLIKLVFGVLLLSASWFGVPQSSVQISFACLLAVAFVKDGFDEVRRHQTIHKVVLMWFINPLISAGLTLILLKLLS